MFIRRKIARFAYAQYRHRRDRYLVITPRRQTGRLNGARTTEPTNHDHIRL